MQCFLGTIEEGTIAESAGSRIAILATEVICNHDLRHNTRRLHWPCDCSKRRSSAFRKASRWSGLGKASSSSSKSSSRSSPFHTQTYLVSGNRGRTGKARQKCKTTRNTSPKRTKYRETGSNPLLKWMWILISAAKKSAQMDSWRTKLWKQNSQIRIQ